MEERLQFSLNCAYFTPKLYLDSAEPNAYKNHRTAQAMNCRRLSATVFSYWVQSLW